MCPLDSTVNGRSIIGQLGRPSTVEMARFQEPHGGETRTVGKLRLRRIRWHYYLAFDLQNNLVHLESLTLIYMSVLSVVCLSAVRKPASGGAAVADPYAYA